MVPIIQLAITLGATVCGVVFDLKSHKATLEMSGVQLIIFAGLAILAARADTSVAVRLDLAQQIDNVVNKTLRYS